MAVEKLINELANHGQFNPASSQHLAYEECGEHCWDEDYDSDYELDEPKNDEPKKEVKPVTLDNLSENINLRLSTLWVQRMKLAVGFGLRDSGSLQGARVRPSSKVTRSVQCPESLRLLLCAHPYSETPAAMCGRCFSQQFAGSPSDSHRAKSQSSPNRDKTIFSTVGNRVICFGGLLYKARGRCQRFYSSFA